MALKPENIHLKKRNPRGIPDDYTYFHPTDTIADITASGYFSGYSFTNDNPTFTGFDLPDTEAVAIQVQCADGPYEVQLVGGVASVVDSDVRSSRSLPTAIAVCGDSISDDSHDVVSATQSGWNDWGWLTWFRRYVNKSYTVSSDNLYAKASQGTAHLLSTQLPQVLSSGCGVCITMIGTNDLGQSVDITGNLQTFYDTLKKNGITAIAMPILPHSSPDSLTAAEEREASVVNRWLYDRSQVDSNMYFLSSLDQFTDYSTGDAVAAYLRDGIHTTKIGAEVIGAEIASQFNSIFSGASDAAYSISGNAHDATDNPDGNALTNPYMVGTSGSLANGATGSVADGCLVYRSSPSSTFGCAASKETINNLPYQVVTLSGTGDGTIAIIEQQVSTPSNWGEGDTIRGRVNIINDFSNVDYFAVGVWASPNVGYDGARTAANGDFPDTATGQWSAVVDIPSGATTIKLSVYAQTKSGSALSGTVKVSKMFIERL